MKVLEPDTFDAALPGINLRLRYPDLVNVPWNMQTDRVSGGGRGSSGGGRVHALGTACVPCVPATAPARYGCVSACCWRRDSRQATEPQCMALTHSFCLLLGRISRSPGRYHAALPPPCRVSLLQYVNWNAIGKVTSIKSQGGCGSCWVSQGRGSAAQRAPELAACSRSWAVRCNAPRPVTPLPAARCCCRRTPRLPLWRACS